MHFILTLPHIIRRQANRIFTLAFHRECLGLRCAASAVILNLTPRPTPRSSERQALLAGEGAYFSFLRLLFQITGSIHFPLASPTFSHFHTPIRRQADLTCTFALQPHSSFFRAASLPFRLLTIDGEGSMFLLMEINLKWKSSNKSCISFAHSHTQFRRKANHIFTFAFHRLIG